jgi:hypothetical protein
MVLVSEDALYEEYASVVGVRALCKTALLFNLFPEQYMTYKLDGMILSSKQPVQIYLNSHHFMVNCIYFYISKSTQALIVAAAYVRYS